MNHRSGHISEIGPRRAPGWLIAAAFLAVGGAVLAAHAATEPVAQPAGAAATSQTRPATSDTVYELAMKGGVYMVPLAMCSLAALTVIIERLVALRHGRIVPPGFVAALSGVLRSPADQHQAMHFCRSQDNPTARVVGAGIAKMHRGEEAMEQAIEDAGANEVAKLGRNLRFLYGIAAVAPMIGLLGTVSGMIKAFQVTSVIVGPEKSQQLAEGIYEALVTTYAGLVVAIPTLIAYYYFQGRIDRLVSAMNDVSLDVIHGYIRSKPDQSATEPASSPDAAGATAGA